MSYGGLWIGSCILTTKELWLVRLIQGWQMEQMEQGVGLGWIWYVMICMVRSRTRWWQRYRRSTVRQSPGRVSRAARTRSEESSRGEQGTNSYSRAEARQFVAPGTTGCRWRLFPSSPPTRKEERNICLRFNALKCKHTPDGVSERRNRC